MLAIMYIDRVLSSLGCLTEKQPNLKLFLEYQSMLNSTKPHKRFSKNDKKKRNGETDQLAGSVRVLSFRLIVMLIIGFAKAKR